MRREHKAVILVLLGFLVLALGCTPALAADPCSTKQAKRDVLRAKREYLRAAKRYREARHVLSATRKYVRQYGQSVGRWTRLARRTGWGWGQLDWLMRQIDQESKGLAAPPANPNDGILQIIPYWYSDQVIPNVGAAYWRKYGLSFPWNPKDVKQSFLHARPMDKSNWWIVGE